MNRDDKYCAGLNALYCKAFILLVPTVGDEIGARQQASMDRIMERLE